MMPKSLDPPDLPELPDEARLQLFADKLKHLMEERGWSQSDLGRYTGISRDSISKYCRARNAPLSDHLNRLAKIFRISPTELLSPRSVKRDFPSYAAQQMSDGNMWLRINQAVSVSTAMEIAALLNRGGHGKKKG